MTSSILLKPSKNQITSSHILNNYRYRCDIYLNKFMEKIYWKKCNLVASNMGVFRPIVSHFRWRPEVTDKSLIADPQQTVNHPRKFQVVCFCCLSEKLHTGKKWTGLTNRNENYDKTGDRENFYSISLLKISWNFKSSLKNSMYIYGGKALLF